MVENMQKKLEIKRNHHYVQADYLRRWSSDKKNIWHTTKTGKICSDSILDVAKQEFFYKAGQLQPFHLEIIRKFSSQASANLQEQHLDFLDMFMNIQHKEKLLLTGGGNTSETDRIIHVLRCNLLEDRHAIHERDARPIMTALADGDYSILAKDKNLVVFLAYFGHQITRTKSFRESVLVAGSGLAKLDGNADKLMTSIIECWWFISYMFGLNIGWSLYSTRSEDMHCLLVNETSVDFITSDQPIINVHPDIVENAFSPLADNVCDFIYPISPRAAFMVNKSGSFPNGITRVSEGFVEDMNQRLAKASEINIFGVTKEAVQRYKCFVGDRKKAASKHYDPPR